MGYGFEQLVEKKEIKMASLRRLASLEVVLLLGQIEIVSKWKLFSLFHFLKTTNLFFLLVSSDQLPMENLRHIGSDFLENRESQKSL